VISDVDEVDDGIPRTMGSANLTPLGIFSRNFQVIGFVKMMKIENITQNATTMMLYILDAQVSIDYENPAVFINRQCLMNSS
jgi:hypothetical protein